MEDGPADAKSDAKRAKDKQKQADKDVGGRGDGGGGLEHSQPVAIGAAPLVPHPPDRPKPSAPAPVRIAALGSAVALAALACRAHV